MEFPFVKTRKETSALVSNHFFNIKQSCELELDYAINPQGKEKMMAYLLSNIGKLPAENRLKRKLKRKCWSGL